MCTCLLVIGGFNRWRLLGISGAQSGAMDVLVAVLRGSNLSAAAQAAGALWSLCVDNDHNKRLVADAGAVPHLVQVVSPTPSPLHMHSHQ